MRAQHKLQTDAVDTQAAHGVEEAELEKNAVIKEKQQATSKKVEDQSEPVSVGALEGNQEQREAGARTERLETGAKGKDKNNCSG